MAIYATINGGVVENTIVADSVFAGQISNDFDHVIQIDELEVMPGVGWLYDENTQTFSDPTYIPPEE